jgi:transcription initiation factor TFIIF subunit beta
MPREFTINMTNRKVTNTYVFSERDIHIKNEPTLSQSTTQSGGNRFSPYPKLPPSRHRSLTIIANRVEATSIVGTVAHECTVTPVMNASYSKTVKSRVLEANQPKRQVQMLADQQGLPEGSSYLYNPKINQPFGSFTGGSARTKADAQNNKATRIPKNELLDLLFKCFQEYAYWSLKGLKEYVKQPEVTLLFEFTDFSQSYLREALEEIAHLNKRGPYALKWSLKPHYNQSQQASADLSGNTGPAATSPQSTKVEAKSEDDVKMEDVL